MQTVYLHGDAPAIVEPFGVAFTEPYSYGIVENFQYAADAEFAVTFWMSTTRCEPGRTQYLYHHTFPAEVAESLPVGEIPAEIPQVSFHYLCVWSIEDGMEKSTVRVLLKDDVGTSATFDFATEDAPTDGLGGADYMHIALSVTPGSAQVYINNRTLQNVTNNTITFDRYFPTMNVADPDPADLSIDLASFDLTTNIYIGGTSDVTNDWHFTGIFGGLLVFDDALDHGALDCIYRHTHQYLFNCIDVTAPENGYLGNCPEDSTLADGHNCTLTCHQIYTPAGTQPYCDSGILRSNITCVVAYKYGCTDDHAGNFDPSATMEDGTCSYTCSTLVRSFTLQEYPPVVCSFYYMATFAGGRLNRDTIIGGNQIVVQVSP